MKFVRFTIDEGEMPRQGIADDSFESVDEIEGDMLKDWRRTGRTYRLAEVELEAPVTPRHIIGIGRNFRPTAHTPRAVPEMPVLFFKPQTSVVATGASVVLPQGLEEVKLEAELAVIIGKPCRQVQPEDALDFVFGYTIGNDISASKFYHPAGHWTIGKAFDTFCPLGPCIETDLDLDRTVIIAKVNGQEVQNASLACMEMTIAEQISYISHFMTLSPGDALLTGTPANVAMVKSGDVMECIIAQIGTLRNEVTA